MLITQKYDSYEKIEIEFRSDIVRLLSNEIPNYQWLIDEERLYKSKFDFYAIHLYFGTSNNRVIGIAQFNILSVSKLDNLGIITQFVLKKFYKIFPVKILYCSVFGTNSVGYFFESLYFEEGIVYMKKNIRRYIEKFSIDIEMVKHSISEKAFDPKKNENSFCFEQFVPQDFYKIHANYEEYLRELNQIIYEKVLAFWKIITLGEEIKLNKFHNIESLSNHYKNDPLYQKIASECGIFEKLEKTQFAAFEYKGHFTFLLVLSRGKNKNIFCFYKKAANFNDFEEETGFTLVYLYQYAIEKLLKKSDTDYDKIHFYDLSFRLFDYRDELEFGGIYFEKFVTSVQFHKKNVLYLHWDKVIKELDFTG